MRSNPLQLTATPHQATGRPGATAGPAGSVTTGLTRAPAEPLRAPVARPVRSPHPAPAPQPAAGGRPKASESFALLNVLVLSGVVAVLLSVWILVDLGGWAYYRTPLRVRGYSPAHALLKPSGRVAHPLGVVGLAMMSFPFLYAARKRSRRLQRFGSLKLWLEFHIFAGIVGPILVTYHTALRFNGIIAVAYWSMVSVVLSGFVGRYFFVRIPKSIRGVELSYEEITARAAEIGARLAARSLPSSVIEPIAQVEAALARSRERLSLGSYVFGQVGVRLTLRRLRRAIERHGVDHAQASEAIALIGSRAVLLGRLAYLNWTKRMFAAWHVFHQPLVYVMFGIAALHTGLMLFLGYYPF